MKPRQPHNVRVTFLSGAKSRGEISREIRAKRTPSGVRQSASSFQGTRLLFYPNPVKRKDAPIMTVPQRRLTIFTAVLFLVAMTVATTSAHPAHRNQISLDWATYSPTSLVLKEFGWVEEEFAKDGIKVNWVFSVGSAAANESLRSRAVDFASTAGVAALNARAQGVPLKSIYVYSKPEWTALVTRPDTGITGVEDLKGKKVAAYVGTDPWFFLLRALEVHGLSSRDVTIVNIPHPEGRIALERGDVDAWAGLDPHMADVQLKQGYSLFYRNPDFNTYGTLNVLEETLKDHPDIARRIIALYERARRWTLDNPEEAAQILAEAGKIEIDVARVELFERTDLSNPIPGENVYTTLNGTIPLLKAIPNNLPRWANPDQSLNTLLVTEHIDAVLAGE